MKKILPVQLPTFSWTYEDPYFCSTFHPAVEDGKVYCEDRGCSGLVVLE